MPRHHDPRSHKLLIAIRTDGTMPFAAVRQAVQRAIHASADIPMKCVSVVRVQNPFNPNQPAIIDSEAKEKYARLFPTGWHPYPDGKTD